MTVADDLSTTISAERSAFGELLAGLAEPDWDAPSLCAGWRVRDTAAHLISGPQMRAASTLRAMTGVWRGYNGRAGHGTAGLIDDAATERCLRGRRERNKEENR